MIFIILLAGWIRSINIGKFGLYGDEKYSIMVVNGISWEGATQQEIFAKDSNGTLQTKYFTPKQFWKKFTLADFDEAIIRTDNGNSATFYGFLWVWKSVFGQHDGALRWMGVLFDCFTILIIFLFCKNILNNTWIGLLAGFFAAIEPFLIAYSHQVRNYPVGIFLTFFSTYLFFKILKNESEKRNNKGWYFAYGLSILLAILTHFYVVLFVFSQFIFLIINHLKNYRFLFKMIITYCISFFFLLLWFTIGSGRYTLETLQKKDEVYLNIAKAVTDKAIETSYITIANFTNIKNKILPILADNFIFSNDIFGKFNGKQNWFFWIILTSILVFLLDLSRGEHLKKRNLTYLFSAITVSLIFYFIFNHNSLYYIYLAVLFAMILQIFRLYFHIKNWRYNFLIFAIVTVLLPLIISILAALKAGHTGNIYQKYLSFGLPISSILMGIGIWQIYQFRSYLAYLFLGVFGVFLLKIFEIDKAVLNDNYLKYTIMAEPRQPNPYIAIATKLESLYQKGDTIIYPNGGHTSFDKFDPQMKNDYISVVDAQMTNIYLPKTAEYMQRIDANEPNKVYLYQLKTDQKIEIFDFEGKKYRY